MFWSGVRGWKETVNLSTSIEPVSTSGVTGGLGAVESNYTNFKDSMWLGGACMINWSIIWDQSKCPDYRGDLTTGVNM